MIHGYYILYNIQLHKCTFVVDSALLLSVAAALTDCPGSGVKKWFDNAIQYNTVIDIGGF